VGAASGAEPRSDLVVEVAGGEPGLSLAGFGVAFRLDVYAVPAAILAGPGLLILLWVLLQTVGVVAWVPAVRRLRGQDERYGARG
jgi:hypothetical protein